jgi:mono/diheme cytochrome c family protein
MSRLPRWIAPVAAGLLAAAAAFAIVTVADDDGGAARAPAEAPTALEGSSGGTIFARMGCGSCHRLAAAGSTGEIGPDLDERLHAHDRASLIAVITDSDRGGDFVAMPEDFGERMNSAELNALVDFLLAAGGEG